MPSGLFHLNSLDNHLFLLLSYFVEISVFNLNSVDPN